MPIEVTKYTCQFRCGKKCVGEKKTMERHEGVCWKNPINQTCKTCSNEVYDFDSDGYREWFSRGCKIKELNSVFENVHEVLGHQNTIHIRPIYKCPYWNKDGDNKTSEFAEALEAEIKSEREGTDHYPYFNKPPLNYDTLIK